MDILSDPESFHVLILNIVKICVIFRSISTHAFNEELVDEVDFVNCIIGGILVLDANIIYVLGNFSA